MHRFFTALIASTACALAAAQSLPSASTDLKISENFQTYTIQADGTLKTEQQLLLKALTTTGAQGLSSYALSYQQGMQSLELLEAHTLKVNGSKLALKDSDIQKSTGQLGGSTGLTYPERHTWQLKFPDVQAGDQIFINYRITQLKPFMPDWHNASWFANHGVATDAFSLTLRAPKQNPWFYSHKALILTDESTANEQVLRFSGSVSPAAYDVDVVNLSNRVAHVVASSYGKPADVGNAFAKLLHAKMQPPAAIQAQIQTIADAAALGKTTPAEVTQALYDWTRKNIRYSAVFLGNGGFEPHDLSVILDKRYGDCKDQTLFLMALLKAKGIEAEPALISTGNDYALFPVGLAAFNHVIVHVPSLKLYLDPTASQNPATELPLLNLGKPVVLARLAEQGGSVLDKAPALMADKNWVETRSKFHIDAQGTLKGEVTVQALGNAAIYLQNELGKIPVDLRDESIAQMFNRAGLRGKGSLKVTRFNRDEASQTASYTLEVSEFIKNTDAGSLSALPQLPNFMLYIGQNIGNYIADTRKDDMRCSGKTVREIFSVTYDPAYKLLRTPPNASEQVDTIRYSANFTREGNTLNGTREFVETNPEMYCTLAQYQARRLTVGKIRRHLASNVIYEQ